MFDRNPAPNGTFSVAGGNAHTAKENPADNNSKTVESLIDSFTSYKNHNGGVWTRGEMKVFKNLKVADSAIGFTSASGSLGRDIFTSRVTESLFVGETENIGNPRTPEEIAYGRSLPKP
jgi:cell migration-inducing and hyaluronan-binding protein